MSIRRDSSFLNDVLEATRKVETIIATTTEELFLRDEIRKAEAAGNFEEVEKLEKQLTSEIARLRQDCEAKKEKLRASFSTK